MDYEGNVLSYYRTGGCYFPETGLEQAMRYIEIASENAMKNANITEDDIEAVVAGITGIDWPGDDCMVADALRKTLGVEDVQAHNDCVIALFSGTQKNFGAALCAGTGINAVIICPDGKQFVMSDYLDSDLQGGSALAYRALRKVFDADLGLVPPTKLTQLFLEFAGANEPYDLLKESIVNRDDLLKRITALVPQIVSLADEGDKVTAELLDEMSRGLCDYFIAGLRKMNMLNVECDLVLAGSVFKGIHNRLTEEILRRLSESAPKARLVNAKYEPVVGACVMGFLQRNSFSQQVSERLEASSRKLGLLRVV